MEKVSNEKQARLKRLMNSRGKFEIVAIDHRAVFKDALAAGLGHAPDREEIVRTKSAIIRALQKTAGAYLIDYDYCCPEILSSGDLGNTGYMIGIEGDDYGITSFSDHYLNPHLSVEKIRDLGGSAVKLFLYYHPDAPFVAKQEAMIAQLSLECAHYGMPFMLEPILFFPKETDLKEKQALLVRMLERLSVYEIDIYKLRFPGDLEAMTLQENEEICRRVTQMLGSPWIILSSGCDNHKFRTQLRIACENGASGFAVGRTLWGDYLSTAGDECRKKEEMTLTFQAFCDIVEASTKA